MTSTHDVLRDAYEPGERATMKPAMPACDPLLPCLLAAVDACDPRPRPLDDDADRAAVEPPPRLPLVTTPAPPPRPAFIVPARACSDDAAAAAPPRCRASVAAAGSLPPRIASHTPQRRELLGLRSVHAPHAHSSSPRGRGGAVDGGRAVGPAAGGGGGGGGGA